VICIINPEAKLAACERMLEMKSPLKFKAVIAIPVLVLTLVSYSGATGKEKEKDAPITVSGAISDSQCAFNVHSDSRSHEWMEKKGVEGAGDDKSCTLRCVKEMGGKYVLVTKKEVYRLSNQTWPEKFAGARVKVTGFLDTKTHTLNVIKIEEDK
jgi:hypothetical protein